MIYSTVQRAIDAGVCEQGRVDSVAAAERDGVKLTDPVSAVWCLDNCGVPGTLWAMRYVPKSSEGEAIKALWAFIMATVLRHTAGSYDRYVLLLHNMAHDHKQNLYPARQILRALSTSEGEAPALRAVTLMLYQAMDDATPLNVRAVQVCEQAMIAAVHDTSSLNPDSTQRYKAEYKLQFKQLKAILNGETAT